MPSRTLWNSARSNRKITSTPTALAISSTIGAEIGAASSIAASGPRTSRTTGCCTTQVSTSVRKALLNSKASAVAMHPPQRKAAANSHGVWRSRRSRSHKRVSGNSASMPESASARKNTLATSARMLEQEEMDGGRKTKHRDQRRTDRDADLAPTQRRTHAQAAVIHIRYHGSAPATELRLFFPAHRLCHQSS